MVTYDVSTESKSGKRRLRTIAQMCLNYGQRVQKSVFECRVNEMQYTELLRNLSKGMNREEDSIRVYKLRDSGPNTVTHLGKNEPIDFEDVLMI